MKKPLLFLFLLIITFLSKAQGPPSFVKDSLDIYVKKGLRDWKIPGVAVCIVKDGKVVLAKGYGIKELGSSEKVDANTLFMIGSNTKAFTANGACHAGGR
jgi:CubicO group peptidase (beta-lactamase class C family)